MQKPYLKKYGEVDEFIVWIVDGFYIRQNIDIDFNNFGQHCRFKYIPKNEFWLDRQTESNAGEEKYFIEHLLVEHKLMAAGKDYNDALDEGNQAEMEIRGKDQRVKKLKERLKTDRNFVLQKIRQKLLPEYSNEKIRTFVVDSFLVRSLFYIDWVAGGHDKIYPAFIPTNELWIDNDLVDEERRFVILHELHERRLMSFDNDYEKAHASALKIENHCHKNPAELEAKIKEELGRQTNILENVRMS